MKIRAELLADIKDKDLETLGYEGGVVVVLGFIADSAYTYAVVAFENKPLFEVRIDLLRYIA